MANRNRNREFQGYQSDQDWDQDRSRYDRENDYNRRFRDYERDENVGWQQRNFEGSNYGNRNMNQDFQDQQGYNRGYTGAYGGPNYGSQYGMGSSWNKNQYGQGNVGGIYDQDFGRESWGQSRNMNLGSQGNYGKYQGTEPEYGRTQYGDFGAGRYGGSYQETSQYGGQYGQSFRQPRNIYGGDTRNYGNANQAGIDRGWWDKTRDEVSSWFGDDEAERRREMDKRQAGLHRGKGPRGYRRSDDRIREDINDRLSDDAFIDASDLEVKVENCNVILTGSVESREDKRRAEDIAERVSGVANVENRIRIESDRNSGSNPRSSTSGSTTKSSEKTGRANLQ